jgi:hypothetical protein
MGGVLVSLALHWLSMGSPVVNNLEHWNILGNIPGETSEILMEWTYNWLLLEFPWTPLGKRLKF